MQPLEYKRSELMAKILSKFLSVPKCACYNRDMIDSDGSAKGEYLHYLDQGATYREIHLSAYAFTDFETFIGLLSHEAAHAAVTDFFTLLGTMGAITKEAHDLITERIGYMCQEIVREILLNEKDFRREFNKVKEKNESIS